MVLAGMTVKPALAPGAHTAIDGRIMTEGMRADFEDVMRGGEYLI